MPIGWYKRHTNTLSAAEEVDSEPMASDKLKWLKKRYREAQDDLLDSPASKQVKFQTIFEDLQAEFPHKHLNFKTVSDIIKQAFPSSESVRQDKERARHIIGIECTDEESRSGLLKVELGKLRDENQKPHERVKALEHTISGKQQGISATHLTRELKSSNIPLQCDSSWARHHRTLRSVHNGCLTVRVPTICS